jgi:glutamyl-Q tRNA(Asp) synthetase
MLISENYKMLWENARAQVAFSLPDIPILRFAPSPTGRLHMGNMYSALYIHEVAKTLGGKALLRIEDIDTTRCRNDYKTAMLDDLSWAGFSWQGEVRQQSQHMNTYEAYLTQLKDNDLIYPCFCSRKDIANELSRLEKRGEPIQQGPEGPLYPHICKNMSKAQRCERLENNEPCAWRLDVDAALKFLRDKRQITNLDWYDLQRGGGKGKPESFGDFIIARKDIGVSYHLCVCVDDHLQNVSLVNRGVDLFHATHIHRLLQALFDFKMPIYDHHALLMGVDKTAMAKSAKSISFREYEDNITPQRLYDIMKSMPKNNDINIKK